MALIKCPDCGKEMSDTAQKCINCGRNLKESSTIGVFIISLLIPILGIIVYLIGKSTSNDKVARAGIKGFIYNIILSILIIILIVIFGAVMFSYNADKTLREQYGNEITALQSELNISIANYLAKTGSSSIPYDFPISTTDTYTLEYYMPSLGNKYSKYLGNVSVDRDGKLILTGVIYNLYGAKTVVFNGQNCEFKLVKE